MMRLFGIIPLGIGLAVIYFLWLGSLGTLGTPPMFFRICGTVVAVPFVLLGLSVLFLSPAALLEKQVEQMQQLARSVQRSAGPVVPAPPIRSTALGPIPAPPVQPIVPAPPVDPPAESPAAAPSVQPPTEAAASAPAAASPPEIASPATAVRPPASRPVPAPQVAAATRRPAPTPVRGPARRVVPAPPVGSVTPPPPPQDLGAALGYVCPGCCAPLGKRADVSPQGDVKCPHCGRWFNIHA